ncbi:MAG: hypothetical protein ACYC6M_13385 [Terriglobales bacterium]
MSTVRTMERRMFLRRQSERLASVQPGAAPAGVATEWSGIWAGYLAFAGSAVLLLFLVLGIGFSNVNPLDVGSWKSLAGGAAIWSGIAILIATFFGAWAAARAPLANRTQGMMRGVALWGLVMITAMMLVGSLAAGAAQAAAGTASAAVPIAAQGAVSEVQSTLQSNGVNVTQAQAGEIAARWASGDHGGAADLLSRQGGISTAQANSLLNQAAVQAQQSTGGISPAKVGRQVAQGAASGASAVAWGGFWLSLLSLIAAVGGGAVGASASPRPASQPV